MGAPSDVRKVGRGVGVVNLHVFVNSGSPEWDGNCSVCGGKLRDSVHGPSDEIRAAWAAERPAKVFASWPCRVTREPVRGEVIGREHPDGLRLVCLTPRGWVQYVPVGEVTLEGGAVLS